MPKILNVLMGVMLVEMVVIAISHILFIKKDNNYELG